MQRSAAFNVSCACMSTHQVSFRKHQHDHLGRIQCMAHPLPQRCDVPLCCQPPHSQQPHSGGGNHQVPARMGAHGVAHGAVRVTAECAWGCIGLLRGSVKVQGRAWGCMGGETDNILHYMEQTISYTILNRQYPTLYGTDNILRYMEQKISYTIHTLQSFCQPYQCHNVCPPKRAWAMQNAHPGYMDSPAKSAWEGTNSFSSSTHSREACAWCARYTWNAWHMRWFGKAAVVILIDSSFIGASHAYTTQSEPTSAQNEHSLQSQCQKSEIQRPLCAVALPVLSPHWGPVKHMASAGYAWSGRGRLKQNEHKNGCHARCVGGQSYEAQPAQSVHTSVMATAEP